MGLLVVYRFVLRGLLLFFGRSLRPDMLDYHELDVVVSDCRLGWLDHVEAVQVVYVSALLGRRAETYGVLAPEDAREDPVGAVPVHLVQYEDELVVLYQFLALVRLLRETLDRR